MSSTFVTVLVGGFGVAGTLAGALLTRYGTTRRDRDQWKRSVEREDREWARQDDLRTFQQRCDSYVDFELQVRMAAGAVAEALASEDVAAYPADDWNAAAFQSMLRLQIFASSDARTAADSLYLALLRWNEGSGSESSYDDAHERFFLARRAGDRGWSQRKSCGLLPLPQRQTAIQWPDAHDALARKASRFWRVMILRRPTLR